MKRISIDDWLVIHRSEASNRPAPGARNIRPAERGELYTYEVDEVCRVTGVLPDGTLETVSRRGEVARLRPDHPAVEKAGWWMRMTNRRLFP